MIRFLNISGIVLAIIYLILMIDTIVSLKKSEGKLLSKVKKPLLLKINLLMINTVLIAIVSIAKIIINTK